MIVHLCAFRFRTETAAETVAAVLTELRALAAEFPQITRWDQGPNLGLRDTEFTHGFVAEVTSASALADYLHDPRHERFVTERWRPNVAARVIVNFEADHHGQVHPPAEPPRQPRERGQGSR